MSAPYVVLPRAESHEEPAPHWRRHPKPFSVPGKSGERVAVVRCYHGHEADISTAVHQVDADGTLRPSYVCPGEFCDFHVYLRLDGWTP